MPFRKLGDPFSRGFNRLGGPSMGGIGPVVYLFRDEFWTDEAAPLTSPRTAEPGPGTGTLVDTGSVASITGGKMVMSGAGAANDPRYFAQSIDRATGLMGYGKIKWNIRGRLGFNQNQDARPGKDSILVQTGNSLQVSDAALVTIQNLTNKTTTEFETAIVLRTAGAFYTIKGGTDFPNWTLIWIGVGDATDPVFYGFGSEAGGTNATEIDSLRVRQLAAPWNTDYGIALLYDQFNRANGALGTADKGGAWTFDAGIWTVAANEAVGSPAAGGELVTNGNFANWAAGDPVGWTVTEVPPNQEISEVGAGVGHGGGGNGECNLWRAAGASNLNPLISQSILTANNWYIVELDVSFLVGSLQVRDNSGSLLGNVSGVGAVLFAGRAGDAVFRINTTAIGSDITIDNASVKQLTLSELFSSLNASENEILAYVDSTIVVGTQAGLVTHLDDAATPANFLIAYHDGTNAHLDKCVGGVYTSLISAAAAYGAGRRMGVIAHLDGSDLKVRLYYNNTLIGAEQTVSDAGIVSNTIHGLFTTYSGNTLDNFEVWPRFITGEARGELNRE